MKEATLLPCRSVRESRKKWERRLLAYRQGFLKRSDGEDVERHLFRCAACRKVLAEATVFLKRLEMTMCLLVSKLPIENLELEAWRLKTRAKRMRN